MADNQERGEYIDHEKIVQYSKELLQGHADLAEAERAAKAEARYYMGEAKDVIKRYNGNTQLFYKDWSFADTINVNKGEADGRIAVEELAGALMTIEKEAAKREVSFADVRADMAYLDSEEFRTQVRANAYVIDRHHTTRQEFGAKMVLGTYGIGYNDGAQYAASSRQEIKQIRAELRSAQEKLEAIELGLSKEDYQFANVRGGVNNPTVDPIELAASMRVITKEAVARKSCNEDVMADKGYLASDEFKLAVKAEIATFEPHMDCAELLAVKLGDADLPPVQAGLPPITGGKGGHSF